jgi:hypothetical protein
MACRGAPSGATSLACSRLICRDAGWPDLEQGIGATIRRYASVFTVMPWPVLPRTDSGKPRRQEPETAFRQRRGAD